MARDLLDVDAIAGASRLRTIHIVTMALCVLLLMMDGYDIYVVGWVIPSLAAGFKVPPSAIASTLALQQIGMIVGTYALAPIADRIGRRSLLLTCTVLASLASVCAASATTLQMFLLCRIATTIACAAILPNVLALVSELAPERFRATAATTALCGLVGGALIGAAMQAWIIGPYGWQGAFWLSALMALVLFPFLYVLLPESVRFLIARDPRDPRIPSIIARIAPEVRIDEHTIFAGASASGAAHTSAIAELFAPGRRLQLVLVWSAFFASYAFISFHASWSSTIFHVQGGLDMKSVAAATAAYTVCGIVGTVVSGAVIDRFGYGIIVPLFFLVGAGCVVGLGLIDLSSLSLLLLVGGLGFFQAGGQAGLGAVAANLYEPRYRATAVGWAYGAGRLGALTGPIVGGAALAGHWPTSLLFLLMAVPLLIGAVLIHRIARDQRSVPGADLQPNA